MAQTEPTQGEIDVFTGNVKKMVTLQDQMKVIASKAKDERTPVKEAFDTVQQDIIGFMKTSDIHVCNYQDEKIELHSVTRYGSLTKKSLKAGLDTFFTGNDVQAEACFNHIIESIGNRELDIIKRVRKRGRKGGKRQKTNEDDDHHDNDNEEGEAPELDDESEDE